MTTKAVELRLNEAITQCVGEAKYPDDEATISAELPSSALAGLGELLDRARADVKVCFISLGRFRVVPYLSESLGKHTRAQQVDGAGCGWLDIAGQAIENRYR